MYRGVPSQQWSPSGDFLAVSRRRGQPSRRKLGSGLFAVAALFILLCASSASAAPARVGLGGATSFSVLAGSTVTNTGPTSMFGDLGLSPGSSVTGAPQVLGQTHVDDAVAIEAKNALTTAFNDAASRPTDGSAGTDLSGQTFTPGVRTAGSSLLLSSGSVTLDAQGDPNAVFIFQIGTTLTTGSNTSVSLINGAQACNVFWEVGSSATLGTGTRFVGTVMAAATITAGTAATVHGRLLAATGAVNLDTNTITNSTCATGGGESSATETITAAEAAALAVATKRAETVAAGSEAGGPGGGGSTTSPTSAARRAAERRAIARRVAARRAAARRRRRAAARHTRARRPSPGHHGAFTG
jgi:hypothetical protein